jgi:hypothetical protein
MYISVFFFAPAGFEERGADGERIFSHGGFKPGARVSGRGLKRF